MNKKDVAERIGYQIGLFFVIGIIAFGTLLHRFLPFIGPAAGIALVLAVFSLLGKVYGKFNQPKLEGLEGDDLLEQQIGIARVIRRFMLGFVVASVASFFVI